MENLQNEVQHILEKYAKYKIGQEVYIEGYEYKDSFTYRKVNVDEIRLECDCYEHYLLIYICRGNRYTENELFSSLNELKEFMINQCMQRIEMCKKLVNMDDLDEVKEVIRIIEERKNNYKNI